MEEVSSGMGMEETLTAPERSDAIAQDCGEQLLCLMKTVSEGIAILDKTG